MLMQPGHDSLARLEARLPLLEKLAAAEKIHPDAVRKVLATIEEDIAFLEVKDHLNEFEPKQRPAAEKVRDAARAALDRVKIRLDGSAQTPPRPATPDNLASNKDWAIVLQGEKGGKKGTCYFLVDVGLLGA
jgi:ParB-like chromosome segregation protein Spo0J